MNFFCLKISNRLSISNFMINQKIKLTFQKSQFSTKGRNNGNETTISTVASSRCRADGRSACQSSLTKGVTHVCRGWHVCARLIRFCIDEIRFVTEWVKDCYRYNV